jgi:hypothetical protein
MFGVRDDKNGIHEWSENEGYGTTLRQGGKM